MLSLFLAVLIGVAQAYSLPGACSGTCVNTHDPAIIVRPDDLYFRFSTGGRIAVHTAPNITGPWTYRGAALPNGSSINLPGNKDLWAPDVALVDGIYYLYYSVSTFGSQTSAIGVARSNSLDVGTWTDLGSTGVVSDKSKPFNAIDGNLLFVNGSSFLTFGSFWNGLYQVPMRSLPTSVSGAQPTQLSFNSADTAQEGPAVFNYGAWYYLFYSKGSCCRYDKSRPAKGKEYKIVVCRSSSPTASFVDKNGVACSRGGGSVVLESHNWVYGPGGQGVYQDVVLGPILYYHYVDTRVGYADGQKQFGWNKIDFSTGWPIV